MGLSWRAPSNETNVKQRVVEGRLKGRLKGDMGIIVIREETPLIKRPTGMLVSKQARKFDAMEMLQST
jgi:hypothetical protein